MTDSIEEHRWVVDSIEEFIASIEVDGDKMMNVPLAMLPTGVHEGHVLSVRHSRPRDGQRSELIIEIDEKATKAALRRSLAQVQKFADQPNDPGGDISL